MRAPQHRPGGGSPAHQWVAVVIGRADPLATLQLIAEFLTRKDT